MRPHKKAYWLVIDNNFFGPYPSRRKAGRAFYRARTVVHLQHRIGDRNRAHLWWPKCSLETWDIACSSLLSFTVRQLTTYEVFQIEESIRIEREMMEGV